MYSSRHYQEFLAAYYPKSDIVQDLVVQESTLPYMPPICTTCLDSLSTLFTCVGGLAVTGLLVPDLLSAGLNIASGVKKLSGISGAESVEIPESSPSSKSVDLLFTNVCLHVHTCACMDDKQELCTCMNYTSNCCIMYRGAGIEGLRLFNF